MLVIQRGLNEPWETQQTPHPRIQEESLLSSVTWNHVTTVMTVHAGSHWSELKGCVKYFDLFYADVHQSDFNNRWCINTVLYSWSFRETDLESDADLIE